MAGELRTLIELMALEAIDSDTFQSKSPSYCPGGYGAAYGGHVFAQSAWAASQTVSDGMVLHNIHGFFTLPGLTDRPYVYTVEHVSEGRSYCTRSVTVRQPTIPSISVPPLPAFPGRMTKSHQFSVIHAKEDLGKVCFKSICSFKRDEPRDIYHQEEKDLIKDYKAVLDIMKSKEHAYCPSVDAPWYLNFAEQSNIPEEFPGLHMRKVDMSEYNKNKSVLEYRQLTLYHARGLIPSTIPNLHAVAHLYASDRNSLYLVGNALNIADRIEKIGSLSHSVVFHANSNDLLLAGDEKGIDTDNNWWIQEAYTPRTGYGRAMHESKIWRSDGLHIASSWQEGMLRRAGGDGAKYRDNILRGLGKL